MVSLVVIAPARRAGDPGSNPGRGENFSLKLLNTTSQISQIFLIYYVYIHIQRCDRKVKELTTLQAISYIIHGESFESFIVNAGMTFLI